LDSVAISPTSANVNLGQTLGLTATAYDAYNNVISTGLDILWSVTDISLGTLSPTASLATTFTATNKSGNSYLNVEITADGITKNNSVILNVLPAPLHHFVFDSISSPQPAQTLIAVKITAQDQYNNVVTSFTDSVMLDDKT